MTKKNENFKWWTNLSRFSQNTGLQSTNSSSDRWSLWAIQLNVAISDALAPNKFCCSIALLSYDHLTCLLLFGDVRYQPKPRHVHTRLVEVRVETEPKLHVLCRYWGRTTRMSHIIVHRQLGIQGVPGNALHGVTGDTELFSDDCVMDLSYAIRSSEWRFTSCSKCSGHFGDGWTEVWRAFPRLNTRLCVTVGRSLGRPSFS